MFRRLLEIGLVNSHLLYKLKPDNESVTQKQFRLSLCHFLVQSLFTLRENPGARVVRGRVRPPVPSDRLIGKHFGQRADKRRRSKVCAYTKNAQGNLISTVQSVMHIFVNSHVFKSCTPNQSFNRFTSFSFNQRSQTVALQCRTVMLSCIFFQGEYS